MCIKLNNNYNIENSINLKMQAITSNIRIQNFFNKNELILN